VIRHARSAVATPSAAVPYVKEKLRLAPMALLSDREIWPWLHYRVVDLHGRRPNALTAKLLPEDRWIGFWYVAKRLARRYVARPIDAPVLGVFLQDNDRRAEWEPLLGVNAALHEVATTHGELIKGAALGTWMDLLQSRLAQRASYRREPAG
jgi:hypothetical protein